MTKQKLIGVLKGLLNTEENLDFLLELKKEDLEKAKLKEELETETHNRVEAEKLVEEVNRRKWYWVNKADESEARCNALAYDLEANQKLLNEGHWVCTLLWAGGQIFYFLINF